MNIFSKFNCNARDCYLLFVGSTAFVISGIFSFSFASQDRKEDLILSVGLGSGIILLCVIGIVFSYFFYSRNNRVVPLSSITTAVTHAQPRNSQPRHPQPTNPQPNYPQSENLQPKNFQPTLAQPTNVEPTSEKKDGKKKSPNAVIITMDVMDLSENQRNSSESDEQFNVYLDI